MCAVSREQRPVDELIRFVVSPQGEVIPDIKRKLPGRGLWISASRQTVAEAVRRHQFSRGFKRDVRVAESLAADTEALLARAAVEALAIAAKAGQVISGFAKVEAALADRKDRAASRPWSTPPTGPVTESANCRRWPGKMPPIMVNRRTFRPSPR